MLELLKEKVLQANLLLPKYGLVTFTWGNVSAIDRESGLVVIKPSGVDYEKLTAADMVVVDLDGNRVEGKLKPSSDTPTHIELYKAFDGINAVVHTHSAWATVMAQAGMEIPCYGTTHADYFYGTIPITRALTPEEVGSEYEKNTGKVIIERMKGIDPLAMPACLVLNHGPFAWDAKIEHIVEGAVVLEEVAKMAFRTMQIARSDTRAPQYLADKHYFRKHGANAYYGN